ncbi:hypothetical protein LV478_11420 [Komagataeibacter oboediens]|uniref:hypothetical protein n=1 Tax=Komagataeibacter oboediens TaxID=65958 RepID=UPI0023DC890B|nr:hypothetical protein [Komagataeibacter oboediens]WEQ51138.1 hypothetical protein LV478_11420 [Komagataeibacter oboediens]
MPFIVFTPIIVTVLGRDVMGTLGIAALVSLFPAFVVMLEGMNRTPRPAVMFWTCMGRCVLPICAIS